MEQRSLLKQLLGTCDAAVLCGGYILSFEICRDLLERKLLGVENYLWVLWVIVPSWLIALRAFGLYRSASYETLGDLFSRVIKTQMFGSLMLLSTMYLTKSADISRVLLQAFIGLSFVGLLIQKFAVRWGLEYLRQRRGSKVTKVLVISESSRLDAYPHIQKEHVSWHSEIVGFLVPESQVIGATTPGGIWPILGSPEDLRRVLLTHIVDEVVVVQPFGREETEQISKLCTDRGLTLRFLVNLPQARAGFYQPYDLGEGSFFLSAEAVPQHPLQLFFKRALDVAGAVIGLLICIPVYWWYKGKLSRETSASSLFAQTRVGYNGRRFTLYKLRTMHKDAERRLKELMVHNEMQGHMFKLKDDPRVTPTGKYLRERHFDELPQFWNVLRGDMSLVGTRPPTAVEVEQYDWHHYRRLSIKPGLTGLWQIKGNGEISNFEEVVKLDCEYIDNWSLWLDVKILARTVAKVAIGSGW
jgi:exopolysaccharide biosynthesis polyprenyl glycosylphosphotransferase